MIKLFFHSTNRLLKFGISIVNNQIEKNMKKLFFVAAVLTTIFISCEKEHEGDKEKENLCPVVTAGEVPQAVKDSFVARYPLDTFQTWFFKDSTSYCALFVTAGVEKLSRFTTSGNFVSEELEVEQEQEGEHEDSAVIGGVKVNPGCKCELPDNSEEEGDH